MRLHFSVLTYLDASVTRGLQSITRSASAGQSVLLPCLLNASNKDWRYQPDILTDHGYSSNIWVNLTYNGNITSRFKDRFELDSDGLLIRNVQTTDQGLYTCLDRQQHRRQIRLFVPCKWTFYDSIVALVYSNNADLIAHKRMSSEQV